MSKEPTEIVIKHLLDIIVELTVENAKLKAAKPATPPKENN